MYKGVDQPVTAIVLGAGSRGNDYSVYSELYPDQLKILAVAEPKEDRRRKFAEKYSIEKENIVDTWEKLLQRPKMADAVFICMLDQMHVDAAIIALEKGYNVLLEKPMSITAKECIRIVKAARKSEGILSVCHVLRYTPFYQTIKKLVESGTIGQVMDICQIENVGYWHQAHSFVRGNWRNSLETSPMILQKCCHDTDIIRWLVGDKCKYVSSFGSLTHFTAENKPEGSPQRCLEGCPVSDECPYNAPKIYLNGNKEWPVDVLSTDLSEEGILKALKEGPYGRCVYSCDNNVVDHQIVNMEFSNKATASLTMAAFNADFTRQIKIMGTKGQITGNMKKEEIKLQIFGREEESVPLDTAEDSGHGGGDFGLISNFVHLVKGQGVNLSGAEESLESHLICFAAEKSRLLHEVVNLDNEYALD